jgi:AbrB family looped-hinge helix DNA binding protein
VKTTITERGQVSIPAELRREMKLTPGQTVLWEKVSATECRLMIEPRRVIKPDPAAAIGFAKRHGLPVRTTAGWMKILREGEDD